MRFLAHAFALISGAGVVEAVQQFIKGFGEQTAKKPLSSKGSEDSMTASQPAENANNFGYIKFRL